MGGEKWGAQTRANDFLMRLTCVGFLSHTRVNRFGKQTKRVYSVGRARFQGNSIIWRDSSHHQKLYRRTILANKKNSLYETFSNILAIDEGGVQFRSQGLKSGCG